MRIPFDAISLAAVVTECQRLVGTRLERVVQWDELVIGLGFFGGREEWLLVSADATYPRAHLVTKRRDAPKNPPPFCAALRKHLTDAVLESIAQRGLDRILELTFVTATGSFRLIAELMGKHSNIVLCDAEGKILASIKVVGASKSKRPIIPGRTYEPPPFPPRVSLLRATVGDELSQFEGASPFLQKLIEAGAPLAEVQRVIVDSAWRPAYAHGHGAYPLDLGALGLSSVPRESISQAIEEHVDLQIERDVFAALRSSLVAQLKRVYEARRKALSEIENALDAAARARQRQEQGELILAYQANIKAGDAQLVTTGYDGNDVVISLDPSKSPIENAQRLFERAKRAKQGAAEVALSKESLQKDFHAITLVLERLQKAETSQDVAELVEEAERRRWLHHHAAALPKEERPFEGHSVKEALSPNGWRVLYGENATSNDYLTTKLAKPNDLWFHVRGVTSAHVVLQTQNRPTSVQREDIAFAARIAVNKSLSKHASYVTVDYTLKKYVRKPRKSAPGYATYSQEKTIHIEQ